MSKFVKPGTRAIDGFDGFEDAVEGEEDRAPSNRVIQGTLVKFTNEYTWTTPEGEELPPDLELVVVDIGRVVQKWKDGNPVETVVLAPGEKFPNIEKLNAQVPRSEWAEGPNGKPRGPYQAQHLVYMVDLKTMTKFTFATAPQAVTLLFVRIWSNVLAICASSAASTSTRLSRSPTRS
jgi:hypothetical protein